MALQVWIPLNGDLTNQGTNGVTFSQWTSGVTVSDNNGKIGKCYINSSHSAGGLISDSPISIGPSQSMFCWFKFTDLESSSSLGGGLVNMHRYPKNTGMGITIKYVSATTGYLSVNTGTGSGRTYNTYCGTTLLQANTWYHGGFTYDGTNVLKIYVNGICEKTVNIGQMSCPEDYMTVFCWSTSNSSGRSIHADYKFSGSINDVRVYDHALSPKEVEILARGLVLHYPMTGGGRGGDNLVIDSQNLYTGSSVSTKYIGCRGGNRQLRDDGFYESKCTGSWQGLSTWSNAQNFAVGDIITYSFYTYISGSAHNVSFYPMMYNSAGTRDTTTKLPISVDGSSFESGNARGIGTISSTTPEFHYVTFEWNSAVKSIIDNGGRIELSIQASSGNWTDSYICFFKPKLEKGNKPTPWMPNPADTSYTSMGYNNNIEYDVSGYNHHGKMMYGSYSSDTPRYSVAGNYIGATVDSTSNTSTGAQWFIAPIEMPQSKAITVVYWTKGIKYGRGGIFCTTNSVSGDVPNTDYNTTAICNWDSKMRLYLTSGSAFNYFTQLSTQLTDNKWHHHCVTYDGTTAKYYQDGVLKSSSNITGDVPAYNGICMGLGRAGGVWRQIQECVSDVRIYATALSTTQVAELYNTTVSLSNNGTLLGYEFIEN